MIVPCTTPAPSSVFRLGGEASAAYVHISYAVNISFGYPTGTVFTNIVDASAAVGPMNLISEQYVLYALGVATNGTHITAAVATASAFLAHANSTTELCVILGFIDGRAQLNLPPPLPYPTPDGTTLTATNHNVWSTAGGGLSTFSWATKTANYSAVTGTDSGILVDATSGNITITLPTAVGVTQKFTIKRVDSSAHTVTIATTSAQTIDGFASATLVVAGHSYEVGSDNANWYIANGYFPNPLTTKGDLAVGGTNGVPTRLVVGANTLKLTADSAKPLGEDWE